MQRELEKREEELVAREKSVDQQFAALAKEQKIFEARSKNLGFNVKRRQEELEQRKGRIKQEAEQEVEEIKRNQIEELEREKEAARLLVVREREAADREAALALQEVEKEKMRVEREKRRVDQEKQEAVQVALGLKAPAPAHWRNQTMEVTLNVRVPWRQGSKALLSLLQASAKHARCDGRDGLFEVGQVKKVHAWRVENPILWRQYISKADELKSRHKVTGCKCNTIPGVPQHDFPGMPNALRWQSTFDSSVNEVLLWHGTKAAFVDTIAAHGFDERVCNLNGMFGAGLYFAQESCKSGQYAEKGPDNSHWFFLCRVILGRWYEPLSTMQHARKAPDGFDSVVFTPGTTTQIVGHHREFIVYDRYQAYPEYILRAFT